MRKVVTTLYRHRREAVRFWAFYSDFSAQKTLGPYFSYRGREITDLLRCYSTSFSSVHGERPSAEYAKLRRESLENEFGHVLGTYSSRSVSAVYNFGPFLALYRAATISFHVVKLWIWQLFVHDVKKRATKFRETLIRLGPFYVKLGQALSTRPDILPTAYCQELAKLQDQIPPFPTQVAIKSIESQLGMPLLEIFSDISSEPIAAASLGQVYKAHLQSGELVAVKVQRPGMSMSLTLDALLFHMIGGQLKRFAKARKDLLVAVNEMVRHMFEEIDYISEGQNAERFASLYAFYPRVDIQSVSGALHASFGDGTRQSQDFQSIMNQLYDIMYELNFSLPPDYALVIRALGSLEGTAKTLDPDFRVLESAYPFVIGRLLADPSPDMRKILRELLIRNDGSIRWNRLERLVAAISEEASELVEEPPHSKQHSSDPFLWKSFDMHSVVAATEDLFQFILSEKGMRVRLFIVRDILKAADVLLQDEVIASIFDKELVQTLEPEGHAMLARMMSGFQSFWQAVKRAPEVWTAMAIRVALRPEFHKFVLEIISTLVTHSKLRIPEALCVFISRLLHKLVNRGRADV
ncbi:hypothetical protein Ancab_023278 [Ancistrocladus abbreviatus]